MFARQQSLIVVLVLDFDRWLRLKKNCRNERSMLCGGGIHRVGEDASLPFSVNLVGVGKAATTVVATALKTLPPSGKKLSALIIDVGTTEPECVREAAALHSPREPMSSMSR